MAKLPVILSLGVAVVALYVVPALMGAEPKTVGLLLNDTRSFDGYTLFSPRATGDAYLIDNDGNVVHAWDIGQGDGGVTPYLLEDGSVIRMGDGNRRGIQQFDWEGTAVWEFHYDGPEYRAHHDIEVLPNGNVLMIAYEFMTAEEATNEGRDPTSVSETFGLWPDKIIEVERSGLTSGRIVWEWRAWDHLVQDFDATKANFGVVGDHPELIDINFGRLAGTRQDWLHTNSVDYNPILDQILLSPRQFSEIWVIDHSTTTEEAATSSGGNSGRGGDLLYRWGNPAKPVINNSLSSTILSGYSQVIRGKETSWYSTTAQAVQRQNYV